MGLPILHMPLAPFTLSDPLSINLLDPPLYRVSRQQSLVRQSGDLESQSECRLGASEASPWSFEEKKEVPALLLGSNVLTYCFHLIITEELKTHVGCHSFNVSWKSSLIWSLWCFWDLHLKDQTWFCCRFLSDFLDHCLCDTFCLCILILLALYFAVCTHFLMCRCAYF